MVVPVIVLTTLFGLILSPVQSSDVPSGQTFGQLVASLGLDRPGDGDPGYNPLSTNQTYFKREVPPTLDDSEHGNELSARSFLDTEQVAAFNGTDGGYQIRLPAGVCGKTVVGTMTGPDGHVIENATVIQVLQAMYKVPHWSLNQYLQNRIVTLQTKMNASFSEVICDPPPGPSRTLAYRFELRDHEGFWEAYLLATAGIMGIGYAGLHLGVIHEGITANITGNQEVWILAMTGVTQFIFGTFMFRLQTKGYVGPVEAAILNFFIIIGESIWWFLSKIGAGTCFVAAAVQSCFQRMASSGPSNMQAFIPRLQGLPGAESALNLVGQATQVVQEVRSQDIEQGRQQIPAGQACP